MKKLLRLTSLLFITALVFISCEKEQDLDVPQSTTKEAQQSAINDESQMANKETAALAAAAAGSAGARTITLKTNTLSCPGGLCISFGVWSEGAYTVWFQMKFN